jgi:hypothetical protein
MGHLKNMTLQSFVVVTFRCSWLNSSESLTTGLIQSEHSIVYCNKTSKTILKAPIQLQHLYDKLQETGNKRQKLWNWK